MRHREPRAAMMPRTGDSSQSCQRPLRPSPRCDPADVQRSPLVYCRECAPATGPRSQSFLPPGTRQPAPFTSFRANPQYGCWRVDPSHYRRQVGFHTTVKSSKRSATAVLPLGSPVTLSRIPPRRIPHRGDDHKWMMMASVAPRRCGCSGGGSQAGMGDACGGWWSSLRSCLLLSRAAAARENVAAIRVRA